MMPNAMNLDRALEQLFHRNLHVIKLDLEPMRGLLALLDHPEKKLLCVHVAGTNGKGSVCAMLESILRAQGYRTGLYTSPHLIRFNERIQVNGVPLGDGDLSDLIMEVELKALEATRQGFRDVTFFEFTTALAFLYFLRQKVDIVVLETGMGGRLDATNVVLPAISVITSIGYDHMAYLGNTLEKIAAEKAGIIKPHRPVVIGSLPDEARRVIISKAVEEQAPIRHALDIVTVTVRKQNLEGQLLDITSASVSYGAITVPLLGTHQASNVAIAVTAAECLDREVGIPVSPDAVKSGLTATRWPARAQVLSHDPPILLDGAHNEEAAVALAQLVKKLAKGRPVGLVASFLADKDPSAFFKPFRPMVRKVWLAPIQSERAMALPDMVARLGNVPDLEVASTTFEALQSSIGWAREERGVVVIAGSFHLAGEVLSIWRNLLPEEKI